jgi:hypothetical protein
VAQVPQTVIRNALSGHGFSMQRSFMPTVYVSTTLDHLVDDVWAVLGDFHGLQDWARMVRESTPEGATNSAPTIGSIRRLIMRGDGQTVRERLVAYDAGARQMSYELTDRPLPLRMTDYLSTVRALPVTETSATFVEWHGQFECASSDDATLIARGLRSSYRHLLGDLGTYLSVASVSAE